MELTVYAVVDENDDITWNETTSPWHGGATSEAEQKAKAEAFARVNGGTVTANEFEFTGSRPVG